MDELAGKACGACRADAPQVTSQQCDELLAQLPQWQLIEVDGVKQLSRVYVCSNFLDAMAQAEKVAKIAEQENHHPALLVEWGKLTVTWWSHKIKGLHENDFVMAARTERLFSL
ncbi:MAG: 4a-hydroxytetrahydrobiopterin dehydratase [Thiotrichaceae bacterium]|nr:4a-hydroxytetrahydrobiopterin dehydratase [Thiotrichaceae bacterium]PCI12965.1 MAG: 4a-hydroxytetrahydrobiopterin dehydratase [Thiotrichales bacterium]